MARNINTVALTGNLTRDPELRTTGGGTAVCSLRIAVNEGYKDPQTGEWGERANFFDITVWGRQGEACAQYLAKGKPVAVQGRLHWREWETDGAKRQAVDVTADAVQFLGGRDGGGNDSGGERDWRSDVPADNDFSTSKGGGTGGTNDDVPF